jgi:hypothetical protein
VWRFAFFALGDPHTSCMTCGPGPPCHRLGRIGARRGRFSVASRGASKGVFLEKGFTPRATVTLSYFLPTAAPFRLRALHAPLHLRSSSFHRRSRHGPASPSRALSSPRWHSTWCATCLDGARRLSPEGSAPAPLPSAILPPRSSCSSSPTSPTGWRCRSRLSSCCCWRSSASNFSTSRPTPSPRRPSSPTSRRCSWGWHFFR